MNAFWIGIRGARRHAGASLLAGCLACLAFFVPAVSFQLQYDRERIGAAVSRLEDDRLRDGVCTLGDDHADRLVQRAGRLDPPHRIAGAGQAGQRAVGRLGVGCGQLTRPRVAADG